MTLLVLELPPHPPERLIIEAGQRHQPALDDPAKRGIMLA